MVSSSWSVMDARMNTTSKCASLQAYEKGWDTCFKNVQMILTFSFFSTLLKLKVVFVQRSERIAMKTWNFTGPWLQKFTLLLSPWTLGLLNPSNSRFFWNAIYRMSQQRTFIFKPHGKKKLKLVLIRKGPRVKSLHSTFSSTLHYGMYFGRSLDVRKNFYLCTDVSICL